MMISTCGTCGRIFPGGDQELQNHIAVTGHQSTFYSCFSCDYRFASQYYAKQHMDAEDHWIPTSPPLSCSKCTSRFSNEEDAEKHEHKIHLRCRPCNVSFPTSQELSMVRCFPLILISRRISNRCSIFAAECTRTFRCTAPSAIARSCPPVV